MPDGDVAGEVDCQIKEVMRWIFELLFSINNEEKGIVVKLKNQEEMMKRFMVFGVLITLIAFTLPLVTGAAQHQMRQQMPMGSQTEQPQPSTEQPPMMGGQGMMGQGMMRKGMMGQGMMGMMGMMEQMMPMMQQMMEMSQNPKTMGLMLQMRGEMMKALGEILMKYGKMIAEEAEKGTE